MPAITISITVEGEAEPVDIAELAELGLLESAIPIRMEVMEAVVVVEEVRPEGVPEAEEESGFSVLDLTVPEDFGPPITIRPEVSAEVAEVMAPIRLVVHTEGVPVCPI